MLLSPLDLGPLTLPNRIVLAPLTRSRHPGGVPNALAPTYYAQRASAGLIVAEASQVTPRGQGYPDTPGIHSDAQVAGWKAVTSLVHAVGGRIVLQLWHVGRVSHSAYHGGELPFAPSPIAIAGKQAKLPDFSISDFETPHAMTEAEIDDTVTAFRDGAQRARDAGFDGVEIHAANGYLIEQFMSSGTNRRTDRYGGTLDNRLRFLDDVTAAVLDVWDADRVGVRFSFGQGNNDVLDANPAETFGAAAARAAAAGLAYVHAIRPNDRTGGDRSFDALRVVRGHYSGVLIANGSIDLDSAEHLLADGHADAVAFGREFLANPDLPLRAAAHAAGLPAALNTPDTATFYGGGAAGYTDYPIWDGAGVLEPTAT